MTGLWDAGPRTHRLIAAGRWLKVSARYLMITDAVPDCLTGSGGRLFLVARFRKDRVQVENAGGTRTAVQRRDSSQADAVVLHGPNKPIQPGGRLLKCTGAFRHDVRGSQRLGQQIAQGVVGRGG